MRLFLVGLFVLLVPILDLIPMFGAEYLNVPPEPEAREVRRPMTRSSPNVIFKGKNKLLSHKWSFIFHTLMFETKRENKNNIIMFKVVGK